MKFFSKLATALFVCVPAIANAASCDHATLFRNYEFGDGPRYSNIHDPDQGVYHYYHQFNYGLRDHDETFELIFDAVAIKGIQFWGLNELIVTDSLGIIETFNLFTFGNRRSIDFRIGRVGLNPKPFGRPHEIYQVELTRDNGELRGHVVFEKLYTGTVTITGSFGADFQVRDGRDPEWFDDKLYKLQLNYQCFKG